jgi:hypothetical protein
MGFWTGKSGWDMTPAEERRAMRVNDKRSTLKKARQLAIEVAKEKAKAKAAEKKAKLRHDWLGF